MQLISISNIRTVRLCRAVRPLSSLGVIFIALLSGGCGTAARLDLPYLSSGDVVSYRSGKAFRHLLIERSAVTAATTDSANGGSWLHVYIEGDGIPWIDHRYVSADPTPSKPLALALMAADDSAAIYLGRPCYFDTRDPHCQPLHWTGGRYGEAVIGSMAAVLLDYCDRRLVLIGYSGGGVIAALLARRLPCAAALVTVAANLDIDAWTQLHGYLPLAASLNPAQLDSGAALAQLHFSGGKDSNVPAATARRFFEKNRLRPSIYPHFDHQCCWVQQWPGILAEIDALKAAVATR